jgi:hypothetical protein
MVASNIGLLALIAFWQPLGGVIWSVENAFGLRLRLWHRAGQDFSD